MLNQENFLSMLKMNLLFILLGISAFANAQESDSEEKAYYFGGSVTATNNGISLLPTFTLGKPAGILDMKVGRKLTFEPQFRFSLEGKPWAFIFWWRYKVVDHEKFRMGVGAHPAVLFKTTTIISNGVTNETIEAQRYIAAEISPDYYLTKNISIGLYYLHGYGLQNEGVKNSDFITVNANFSHIKLVEDYYLGFKPQLYYLLMDGQDGFYITSAFTVAKDNFPLTIQSIINQPIKTNITGGKNFVWNVSLIYSFGREYVVR